MKQAKTKKYPIFTYLCYLLVVSVLLTGVTFSRYSVMRTGDYSADIASFNCRYEIDYFSSFSFDNSDYYSKDDNGNITGVAGSARQVRFSMYNYTDDGTAGVDVQGGIKLYLPAMLADNLAIQLQQEKKDGESVSVYYPQFVLGEIIYGDSYDAHHNYIVNGGNTEEGRPDLEYENYVNVTGFSTNSFTDYGGYGTPESDEWTINGGLFEGGGYIHVAGLSGFEMTITAVNDSTAYTNYSLGFQRNGVSAPLYLDLSVQETYYMVEISLPGMKLTGNNRSSCQYMAYLTLTHSFANNLAWNSAEYEKFITSPPSAGNEYTIEGITVTGYHFDQTAKFADTGEETTVRVKCAYDNGSLAVSLYHVAPINEDGAYYVHPITSDIVLSGNSYDYTIPVDGNSPHLGSCSNGRDIVLDGITLNPLAGSVNIGSCISRSFNLEMTAVFVQASSQGGTA